MNNKYKNIDKCFGNLESAKDCIMKALKSPSNWALIIVTYMIWSLVGMRYSSNQNFDMVVAQQHYMMLLSVVSILSGLINHTTKLVKLAFIGAISTAISFLTIAVSKVGITWLGYPIGYYVLCPMSLFLFLLQIKQITCFAFCKYCEVLKSSGKVNDMTEDSSDNFIKEVTKHDPRNNKQQNSKK